VRGLTTTGIKTMTALLEEDEFYPLSKDSTKLEGGVVGFIGICAAKAIDYEYETLPRPTIAVIDNFDRKNGEGIYYECGLRVKLM
jgi:hypothetical protein